MATTRTKDYAAIAAAKIRQPQGNKREPRILVYGRNKKGKTRLCATAPDVLILDPEDGTKYETKINPETWPIDKWEDINDAYLFLKGGGVSPKTGKKYQWVAIDAGTRIAKIALRWVMAQAEERDLDRKPNQVGKQDYGRAGEMFAGMLFNFHSLSDVGLIITCGERMIEFETDESDEEAETPGAMFVPDLPKGARGSLNSIVDVIGRIYTVTGEFPTKGRDRTTGQIVTRKVQRVQRRLWVGTHSAYDTGYRSEFTLPNYIEDITVPRLITVLREGKI